MERRFRRLLRWNAAVLVHRAQRPGDRCRRAHLDLRGRLDALRGRSQPLLPRAGPPGWRGPDLLPGACLSGHVRAGLPRGPAQRGRPQRLPAGEVQGPARPVLLPAPAADAALLAVPDGVDGHRSDERDLPGAVQPLSARPGDRRHLRPASLGLPRRRRDGRTRVPRDAATGGQRRAGQPLLRDQLQPAAAGRPGPRQRQDRPGAGGVLPRRRLERDQGALGPGVGCAAGARTPPATWSGS